MDAYIYVHANNEIVEKYIVEINELGDIYEYYNRDKNKYGENENFCFDVMIL